MEPRQQNLLPNPQTDANCLSKLSFWWTQHVLRLGYQHRLDDVDIYDVLPEDSSIKLSNDLGREWEKESYKFKTGGRASLQRSLFTCYGVWVLATGVAFLVEEGLRLAQAVFLGLIISYFEEGSHMSTFEMYMYALGWSLSYLFIIILDNIAFHKSFYLGLKMRVACTSLIYRKLLRLSQSSLHNLSSQNIVNLFSIDAHRFDQSCLGLSYLWISAVETLAIVSLLWLHYGLGAYCLIGVTVIVIISPIQLVIGSYLAKLRGRMSRLTDRRMRAMNEIITGISSIKINCWEKPFTTLVHTLRRSEWLYLKSISHCRCLNSALHLTSGKLVMMGTFLTYVFLGNFAPASVIFPALALYDILRASLGLLLPWGIRHVVEVKEAVARLQHFLLLEERNVLEAPTHLNILNIGRPPLPENMALHFEDYSASWGKDHATSAIADVNIQIAKGQMVSIMGSVGSGKTSLIMAVLGEIPRVGGFIRTVGKFAYVSQNPWVYSGTIRDNILFGTPMERRKYSKALQSCDLIQDLECLADGDLSFIGENGVSLTNVQKAKVCLARAVYQDADTYLIDDILTAMDAKTAVQLFTKCFCGALNSKTILFVSSNLNFIRAADNIVIMKDGRIQSQGSYEDLKNIGVSLPDLLAEYGFPVASETEVLDLPLEIYESLKESVASIQSQSSLLSTLRQKLSGEAYSSDESLDTILVEYKQSGEKAQLLDDDRDCKSGGSGLRLYFSPAGGVCSILIIAFLSVLVQVTYIMSDWWLYTWIQSQSVNTSSPITENITSSPSVNVSSAFNLHFYLYLILVAMLVATAFLRAFLFSSLGIRISSRLHRQLFVSVMRAPLSFFKKYSISRILSRFSRDMGIIDDPLPATLLDTIQFFCLVLGAVVMVGVTNFWLFLLLVPLTFVFIYARFYYMQTARDIKRIELAARTPVYHHLSTTVEGLWTIRAFQSEERFVRFFDSFQDRHTASSYMYLAISRWFAIRLDLLSVLIIVPQAFLCVLTKQYINGALLGLSMSYVLNLMGLLQYAVKQSTELETQFSSVQRVHRFSQLKAEGEAVSATRPTSLWPQYGIVTFEGVTMVLEEEGQKVLKNLWCCIRAEEKVGILGQPECSKQGFVSVILRLVEHTGTIRIDGMDVSEIGLRDLREKISVVPQDPELFSGSVRRNMDPLTRYPDVLLWKALSEVNLKEKIERLPGGMYADLGDYEGHLNLGERQLLCLARAILHNSKIVIMEETASVLERRVANHISHILRTKFDHCTLIIIAQRIHTVIDVDRVMILDEGRVREFDSAHYLLQNTNSAFHRIVHQLPASEVTFLEHMAREKYENKPYIPPPQSLGGDTAQPIGIRGQRHFLPSFQTSRLSGVLSHFSGNRFSTNRF